MRRGLHSKKSRIGVIGVVVLLCVSMLPLSAYAAGYQATSLGATSSVSTTSVSAQDNMSMFGVDVSVHNGTINWATASQNVNFAILRCGYGNDEVGQDDRQWINNVSGCRKYGVPFGVYIYSYATNTTMAKSEARHVIRCLRNAGLSSASLMLPIYYDMEDKCMSGLSNAQLASLFNTFRQTLLDAGYSKVGVYASASWWEYKLTQISIDPQYKWVAHWGASTPGNGYPATKAAGCGIWQYGSDGSVAGIPSRVDVNRGNTSVPFYFNQNVDGYELKVFRLFQPRTGEHLYTTDAREASICVSKWGWSNEGVAWIAPRYSSVPVCRLYHPKTGDHHYTINAHEISVCTSKLGWQREGVAFYSEPNSSKKLYRLYNPRLTRGAHHYTISANEKSVCISKLGWRDEGYGWGII